MNSIERKARKRVKEKKGFFAHLSVFISVGLFFLFINIATFHGTWWFFFPLLPWLIGLSIHYFSVFGFPGSKVLSPEWEAKELEREIRRLGGEPTYEEDYDEDDYDELELKDEDEIKESRPQKSIRKNWDDRDMV